MSFFFEGLFFLIFLKGTCHSNQYAEHGAFCFCDVGCFVGELWAICATCYQGYYGICWYRVFDGEDEGWGWELGAYEEIVVVTSTPSPLVEFGDRNRNRVVALVEERF